MKKQRQNQKSKSAQRQSKTKTAPASESRRDFLRMGRNAAIGLPIVAAGCYFAIRKVQGDMHENDLTRIGSGKPTIVQIHDPQCPDCNTLQGQTRRALRRYDDDDYTYLVANLTTDSGFAFANQFGVSRVTLLLFTGDGDVTEVVRGPLPSAQLEATLARHING